MPEQLLFCVLSAPTFPLNPGHEARTWGELSPTGWIQAVGAFLLLTIIPILVWFARQLVSNSQDQQRHNQSLFDQFQEQTISMVDHIQKQGEQIRLDHREDIKLLLADSAENRKVIASSMDKIATKIETLGNHITKHVNTSNSK